MADVQLDPENTNANELKGQGIKAFILRDFNTAVQALSKASELLVNEHGDDLHDSLGDVYLYYGKSLLELSREESEPLGDAVPKGADEDSDAEDAEAADQNEEEEKEEIGEKVNENGVNNKEEKEAKGENIETDDNKKNELENEKNSKENEENTKIDEKSTIENENTTENDSASNTAQPSGSKDEESTDETAENDDEPTDLQVAWEVLELAKKIFQKRGEEGKKKLAEALIVLGEVSLESENFTSAVNDINEGLKIQKSAFGSDSRKVAETCYKLGIAYSTNSQLDESIQCFNESMEYLKNRINTLEDLKGKETEESKAAVEELEEIKALIPDIEEKIADMKNYKDEALKKVASVLTEAKPSNATSHAGSSKEATDISHLVKRKRKAEEDPTDKTEEMPAKKSAA